MQAVTAAVNGDTEAVLGVIEAHCRPDPSNVAQLMRRCSSSTSAPAAARWSRCERPPGGRNAARLRAVDTEPLSGLARLLHEQAERFGAALDAIAASVATRGYPPSIRELTAAIGVRSVATAADWLRWLELKGRIKRDPNRPRALTVITTE